VSFVPISRPYMKAVLTFLGDPCADVHTLTASESNFSLSKKHSNKPIEREERRLARRGTRATVGTSNALCTRRTCFVCATHALSHFCPKHWLELELELELKQTQMAQKPMLRAELYAHAMRASQNRKKEVRREKEV